MCSTQFGNAREWDCDAIALLSSKVISKRQCYSLGTAGAIPVDTAATPTCTGRDPSTSSGVLLFSRSSLQAFLVVWSFCLSLGTF
ncbi:MAG: hypothetical protein ABR985_08650 [Methanotrichaceae archaeon]